MSRHEGLVAPTRTWAAISAAAAAFGCTPAQSPATRTATGFAQGTTYSLQWVGGGADAEVAAAAEQELERIDALLSNYRPDSTLEGFNAARTTAPVELPAELVALLQLAKAVHAASDGCFDPTVRPLVRLWGFDGDTPAAPSAELIEAARAIVGLDKLEVLDATHVRKTQPELEVDMASIGQGYTAARLAELLEQHGSTAYLAEIGGEIVARGTKPGELPWRIGVENPVSGAATSSCVTHAARTRATAAITSGSYRHYFEADGRRFGHIIDPRTRLGRRARPVVRDRRWPGRRDGGGLGHGPALPGAGGRHEHRRTRESGRALLDRRRQRAG